MNPQKCKNEPTVPDAFRYCGYPESTAIHSPPPLYPYLISQALLVSQQRDDIFHMPCLRKKINRLDRAQTITLISHLL
jgi:hypothetical protein